MNSQDKLPTILPISAVTNDDVYAAGPLVKPPDGQLYRWILRVTPERFVVHRQSFADDGTWRTSDESRFVLADFAGATERLAQRISRDAPHLGASFRAHVASDA